MSGAEAFYEAKLDREAEAYCNLCGEETTDKPCPHCSNLTCEECQEEHLNGVECEGICTHCCCLFAIYLIYYITNNFDTMRFTGSYYFFRTAQRRYNIIYF